jgi:hypothetical protein
MLREEELSHFSKSIASRPFTHRLVSTRKGGDEAIPEHPNLPRAQFLTSSTALILMLTNREHYVSQKRLTY